MRLKNNYFEKNSFPTEREIVKLNINKKKNCLFRKIQFYFFKLSLIMHNRIQQNEENISLSFKIK